MPEFQHIFVENSTERKACRPKADFRSARYWPKLGFWRCKRFTECPGRSRFGSVRVKDLAARSITTHMSIVWDREGSRNLLKVLLEANDDWVTASGDGLEARAATL